jgi:hypothetical protein
MDQASADEFVHRFAEYWQAPSPDRLRHVLADDVVLVTPRIPTTEGLAAAIESFTAMLELAPDLVGEVHRWGPHPDGCFIEFTLRGTVNGRAVSWRAVDSFEVGGHGLATKRVSFFDPTALIDAVNGVEV